jgi:3',5'-cyclic AMP phosphodiesterase CpdA
MRLAVTADLHWGHNALGDQATGLLLERLKQNPPDVLLLGGDLGVGLHFQSCLELFEPLPCPKLAVPGNHDLWTQDNDPRGDSLQLFQKHLPDLCARHGFHYLDQAPFFSAEPRLAVVGTINWYDYSWALEQLQRDVPDWQWRLEHMAFTRGRHNDRRFVRWPLDDVSFTRLVVGDFERHLRQALERCEQVVVLTHHPAFYDLSFPREGPPSVPDGLLWDAFSGNAALPALLEAAAERIACVFSGHTHRAREGKLGSIRGINVGGDYRWKRLVELDWPGGALEYHEFGDKT